MQARFTKDQAAMHSFTVHQSVNVMHQIFEANQRSIRWEVHDAPHAVARKMFVAWDGMASSSSEGSCDCTQGPTKGLTRRVCHIAAPISDPGLRDRPCDDPWAAAHRLLHNTESSKHGAHYDNMKYSSGWTSPKPTAMFCGLPSPTPLQLASKAAEHVTPHMQSNPCLYVSIRQTAHIARTQGCCSTQRSSLCLGRACQDVASGPCGVLRCGQLSECCNQTYMNHV